jgi:hypothetical protein
MTASRLPVYRQIALQERDGEVFARYNWRRYRFMFSDGATLDVNAIRDDSDLREAVLLHHYGKLVKDPKDGSIVGVATLSVEPEPQVKPPPRKRSVRRVDTPEAG